MNKVSSFFVIIVLLFNQSLAIDSRTIGGEAILDSDKTKPWLINFNNSCTASLISDKFVLTAFHCIYTTSIENIKETYYVKLRENGEKSNIKNIYLPYEEHQKNIMSDVVVLELTSPLQASSYVKIPNKDFINKYYGEKDIALLLGYGVNDIQVEPFTKPTQLELSIMNKEACSQLALKEGRANTSDNSTDRYICSDAKADGFRKGKDIGMCAGDSGGPLVIKDNNEFYQVGVISGYSQDGGSPDCGKNSGFYANISYHSEWIKNILANKVQPTPDYGVEDISELGSFYAMMEQTPKDVWILMGTSNLLEFDTTKMPPEFYLFLFKSKFIKYTETSKKITIDGMSGFWFMKK